MDILSWIAEFKVGLWGWVESWAATPYGTHALFILAFAESSFFPVPPDVLLIALCLARPGDSFTFAWVTAFASVLGGAFGYLIGLKGGRPILDRLVSQEKIRLVEDYYQRYDVWAVGIAGFTVIPYKVFTISAGVFLLSFPRFILASVISRSARFFLVAGLFYYYGEGLKDFVFKNFEILSLIFAVLLVGGFIALGWMGKRRAKTGTGGDGE